MISDVVTKCIGEEAKYDGIQLLFDGLQQPLLNKQVKSCSVVPLGSAWFCVFRQARLLH